MLVGDKTVSEDLPSEVSQLEPCTRNIEVSGVSARHGRLDAIDEIRVRLWMFDLLQRRESLDDDEIGTIDKKYSEWLLGKIKSGKKRDRDKALTVLARQGGIGFRCIGRCLGISPSSASRYWRVYETNGIEAVFQGAARKARLADDKDARSALFEILHSPPSDHGINRTSWRLDDLRECLGKAGFKCSKHVVRAIVRSAGYRWRKAKVVLTSHDPEYKVKLAHIQSILSNLGPDDRFFSIDEFGPFAVKMKGGRRLVGPGERPTVPQHQKSKGSLIATAALELSTNQVTHFYSEKKNTDEMLRLLEVLLEQYRSCDNIYLSWDAASWHVSKALNRRVDDVNDREFRLRHGTPHVHLAPLPASAQFLNVIESVLSGMAKAVVQNSDYASVDEAKKAIDRHFHERNEHFQKYPRRAGKKIWGCEIVPSEFSPSNNCKDSRWR